MYIVQVIKTNCVDEEDTIFEMEFEDEDLPSDERRACREVLSVCASGCR